MYTCTHTPTHTPTHTLAGLGVRILNRPTADSRSHLSPFFLARALS